jgi:excisionase family DNA binding protein
MSAATDRPVLLTASQAASLLGVSDRTIRRWIKADRIPSLKLASGEYRIAQGALLASLRGTYDLSSELRQLEEKHGHLSDKVITEALRPRLAEGV